MSGLFEFGYYNDILICLSVSQWMDEKSDPSSILQGASGILHARNDGERNEKQLQTMNGRYVLSSAFNPSPSTLARLC